MATNVLCIKNDVSHVSMALSMWILDDMLNRQVIQDQHAEQSQPRQGESYTILHDYADGPHDIEEECRYNSKWVYINPERYIWMPGALRTIKQYHACMKSYGR
jgi:hypothetical protein